jgi:hypothetical protein
MRADFSFFACDEIISANKHVPAALQHPDFRAAHESAFRDICPSSDHCLSNNDGISVSYRSGNNRRRLRLFVAAKGVVI